MREWLNAGALAGLALPGLPTTKRGVTKHATENGWYDRSDASGAPLYRRKPGRGGGFEYHVSLLPQPALAALHTHALKASPNTSTEPVVRDPAPEPQELTSAEALRRDARLHIVTQADANFRRNPHGGATVADRDFAARYNSGRIDAPHWVREALPSIATRSIRRWRAAQRSGDWHMLAGRYRNRERSSLLDRANGGAVAEFIGAYLIRQPHLNAAHIRDLVSDRFGGSIEIDGAEKPLPTLRNFQRFVAGWKERHAVAFTSLTDPDRFKSTMRFSGQDMNAHVERLNQLWEIDASPADVLTVDGRFNLYAVVDIYSRRMMCLISRTPTTEASLLLVRRAILEWGVPETLRTDNGADFVSHRFKRALNALSIEQDVTAPFSPEQKGTVERHIGTLQRGLMPLLPGFIGHSVADRKQIEARKAFAQRLGESDEKAFCVDLTADELQTAIDSWCESKYAHKAHGGLKGETPFARASSYTGTIRRIENVRALDLLLAPVAGLDGYRTVTKRGIRLDGAHFMHPALQPGARVFCRCDPGDMGRLYVFEDDSGAFVCEAICPERTGVDPKAAVAAARRAQKALIDEETAEIRRAAKAIRPRDMVDGLLRGADREHGNVTAFPTRHELHSTPDLYEAAIASEEAARSAPEFTPEQAERHARLVAEMSGEADAADENVVALPETGKQRFARAFAIREAIDGGADVSADDARWLGSYEMTPEFKAHTKMLEEWGVEWLEA